MPIYEFVRATEAGHLVHRDNDLAAAAEELGLSATGFEARAILRPCLLGLPHFSGFVGPCYGGQSGGFDVIRYEETRVFNELGV